MPFTEEHRKKLSESIRASWSDERRKQYSEARRGDNNPFFGKHHRKRDLTGEKNPFFGKRHKPESIAKLSKSKMGKCSKLYRYGVTDEQYKHETEAGNRWCHRHKGFKPSVTVSNKGVCSDCKTDYERERMLKARYGVTAQWYDAKLAEQDGGCAICGTSLLWRKKRFLAIDHCHNSKQNRGILCHRCNSVLGYVEKPGWITAALAYLEKYKCPLNSSLRPK